MALHPSNVGVGGVVSAAGWDALGPVLTAADELASYADTDLMLRRAVEISCSTFMSTDVSAE